MALPTGMLMRLLGIVLLGLATQAAAETALNPIHNASEYTTKLQQVENGVLHSVAAPDTDPLKVLHIFGDARQRGLAHGQLLSTEIIQFIETELDLYYRSQVRQIPLNTLPVWLQQLISKFEPALEEAAPAIFAAALGWVFEQQHSYMNASQTCVLDEMAGIADGVCLSVQSDTNSSKARVCKDKNKLLKTIQQVNMLPELIRMQCSMMGAWGGSTPSGDLTQLRTLDFGGGPFANRNLLVVHHPTDSINPFAALSFPGFVGIVTGFSPYIAQSEKVDDVEDGKRPQGSYEGQPVSMVIRDIVQLAETKEDAIRIAQAAKRTWSVWLGVGDKSSQQFTAVLYDRASATPYDDQTLPQLTNQTAFADVAYIDKHPQPSLHPDMPALIKQFYGKLDAATVAQNIPRMMQSGDVHVAVYDFTNQQVLLASGKTDGPTGNFTRKACDAPFLRFDLQHLWAQPAPRKNASAN